MLFLLNYNLTPVLSSHEREAPVVKFLERQLRAAVMRFWILGSEVETVFALP